MKPKSEHQPISGSPLAVLLSDLRLGYQGYICSAQSGAYDLSHASIVSPEDVIAIIALNIAPIYRSFEFIWKVSKASFVFVQRGPTYNLIPPLYYRRSNVPNTCAKPVMHAQALDAIYPSIPNLCMNDELGVQTRSRDLFLPRYSRNAAKSGKMEDKY